MWPLNTYRLKRQYPYAVVVPFMFEKSAVQFQQSIEGNVNEKSIILKKVKGKVTNEETDNGI